jgi:hypothetical protein
MDLLHKIKRKSGEDTKEEELVSKELIVNYSEHSLDSKAQVSHCNIKLSTQALPSAKSEIEVLRKENAELQQSINEIVQETQLLE